MEPLVTIPYARRASIAPEVSVQLAPWNGPPSNWVIGRMRGKPVGSVKFAGWTSVGPPPRRSVAAELRSSGESVGTSVIGDSPGPGVAGASLKATSGPGPAGVSAPARTYCGVVSVAPVTGLR